MHLELGLINRLQLFLSVSTQPAAQNCNLSSLTTLKGMGNVVCLTDEIVLRLLEWGLMGKNAFR